MLYKRNKSLIFAVKILHINHKDSFEIIEYWYEYPYTYVDVRLHNIASK
jgi:hypothetical protein